MNICPTCNQPIGPVNPDPISLCPARYDIPGVISFLCALSLDHEGPHQGARETGPSITVTP